MKKYILKIFLTLLLGFSTSAFAWDRSIEFGYGVSHDPNHTRYNNSGFLLNADIWPLWRTPWTFWSINAALGQWHTTTPVNQDLTTGALSLALRYYFYNFHCCYPAYLLGSVGPAYISHRSFGYNEQGNNLTFQWFGGLGVELNKFDINLRLAHYSNAHYTSPDDGFTVLYLLSIGYLF